jgi:hypothetical protein
MDAEPALHPNSVRPMKSRMKIRLQSMASYSDINGFQRKTFRWILLSSGCDTTQSHVNLPKM